MASLPTSEESARHILKIFHESSRRPGEVLRQTNFLLPFNKGGWRSEDFNSGIIYAAEQGWVELLERGISIRLTERGFEEAHKVDRGNAGKAGYHVHVAGDNARVNINSTDNSHNTVVRQPEDMSKLAEEFERLRLELLRSASSADQFAAMGAVASAEIAAKEGNESKLSTVLSGLGAAGQWVFNIATEIGVHLAAAALKPHLGLPPG